MSKNVISDKKKKYIFIHNSVIEVNLTHNEVSMRKSSLTKHKYGFYKKHPGDKIWWVHFYKLVGHMAVTFDKKKILFLFGDYPVKFTPEEKALFDKENPYWANFFEPLNEEFAIAQKFSIFNKGKNLESSLNRAKKNYRFYDPGSFLYRKIVSCKFKDKFNDDFLEKLYVTMSAWNKDANEGKLKDYSIFADSIKKHKLDFKELNTLKLRDLDEWVWEECREILTDLFDNLELVNSKTPIFAFSKLLHLMLPNLIVPINRDCTMQFFYGKTERKFKSLNEQYDMFWFFETIFCEFVKRNDVSRFVDDVWIKNIPGVLENAIAGKILRKG